MAPFLCTDRWDVTFAVFFLTRKEMRGGKHQKYIVFMQLGVTKIIEVGDDGTVKEASSFWRYPVFIETADCLRMCFCRLYDSLST